MSLIQNLHLANWNGFSPVNVFPLQLDHSPACLPFKHNESENKSSFIEKYSVVNLWDLVFLCLNAEYLQSLLIAQSFVTVQQLCSWRQFAPLLAVCMLQGPTVETSEIIGIIEIICPKWCKKTCVIFNYCYPPETRAQHKDSPPSPSALGRPCTVHKMDLIHHNHLSINIREVMAKIINKMVLLKILPIRAK